ncbi:MAG: site-2 protease family protein [Christensenellaceae bacterium]|jgi:Zn-dependent protease|nr:site-2 protease family protein [Christensenellaceae bacterium]
MFNILRSTNGDWRETLIILVFYVFAVLSALILHEIAHGWVAYKCGDPTAKFARRLNFNPANHLDPFGTLCFLLIGFGWAKPVPINPYNFRNFKKGSFLVSIAGIVTNLIIGFVASLFWVLLRDSGSVWVEFFYFVVLVNVSFAVFNFLPIPPLDGFNIWASLSKPNNRTVLWLRDNQMTMLVVLIMVIQLTNIIQYLQSVVLLIFLNFWLLFL